MNNSINVTRIFDYFVICGLDSVTGLVPFTLHGKSTVNLCAKSITARCVLKTTDESNLKTGPLDTSFNPAVIAHFPEHVSWNKFDGSAVTTVKYCLLIEHFHLTLMDMLLIFQLCLPQGVHFSAILKENIANPKEPRFHPFVITKENGSKVYGFSLIFYEQVADESIINAVTLLQKMHSAQGEELSANQSPKAFQGHGRTSNSKSLPRHFKVTAPHLVEKKNEFSSDFDPETDILLVTKSITLTSQFPAVEAAKNFLLNLYRWV